MLIVLMILTALSIIFAVSINRYDDLLGTFLGVGSVILGIIDLVIIGTIISGFFKGLYIKDKISMYQQENTAIETQLTKIVNNYQGYEKETISSIADMEVALIKFPELKTSELVSKQMEVYIENNKQIKQLKSDEFDFRIYKWLLYFGK